MGSGCGSLIADKGPSSATQLPIPAALHARFPTLFVDMIHEKKENVNPFFQILPLFTLHGGMVQRKTSFLKRFSWRFPRDRG